MLPLFIGDETTAAAYRLAGLEIEVATPAEATARLAEARRRNPPLVLITAECAAAISPDTLDAALSAFAPPLAIVPDAAQRVALPDLSPRVRATLGISA